MIRQEPLQSLNLLVMQQQGRPVRHSRGLRSLRLLNQHALFCCAQEQEREAAAPQAIWVLTGYRP